MEYSSGTVSESVRLRRLVGSDLKDRKDWKTDLGKLHDLRLRDRTRRRLPYPHAPQMVEPLIDDNIVAITSAENSILWSARQLATFLPLTQDAWQYKRQMERGFDTLLRVTLDCRAKIENLFDTKNETGMGVARLTVNTKALDGDVLPDFEPMPPQDVVVPKDTRKIRDADRIALIFRYTEREFRDEARRNGWANTDQIIRSLRERGDDSGGYNDFGENDEYGESRSRIVLTDGDNSVAEVCVWYVYHYRKDGAGIDRKWLSVFVPDEPENVLFERRWKWDDVVRTEPVVDPVTGEPQIDVETGQTAVTTIVDEGADRAWPVVQFRYENRSLQYYDVRGVSQKLKNDQKEATANKNAKATVMDYAAQPFLRGARGKLKSFQFRAGEILPDGAEFVIPPRVDPIFDYNMDMARRSAARRVGAPQGAFSGDNPKDNKTATEVSYTALTSNRLSSDAVERFIEPLGELFQLMFEFMQHYPPKSLVGVTGDEVIQVPPEAFEEKYLIVPGISGRSANPDLILRQLQTIGQVMAMFPQMAQFFRGAEMAQFVVDQMDPKLTPHLVVTPQNGTAPIEQQMQQVIKTLVGDEEQQGLVEQAHNNSEMLTAIAQESLVEDQNEKYKGQVESRAPTGSEGEA